jgi:hypothetical protein
MYTIKGWLNATANPTAMSGAGRVLPAKTTPSPALNSKKYPQALQGQQTRPYPCGG